MLVKEPSHLGEEGMPRVRSCRRGPSVQALICALALLAGSTIGLGWFYAGADHQPTGAVAIAAVVPAASAIAAIHAQPAPAIALVRREMAMLDPTTTGGFAPVPFGRSAPLRGWFDGVAEPQVVEAAREAALDAQAPSAPETADARPIVPDTATVEAMQPLAREIPLPVGRPALAIRPTPSKPRQVATRAVPAASEAIAPPSDGRTLLERMFGAPAASAAAPALAYATPEDSGRGFFGGGASAAAGTGTAVYNIAKHTVTLPDGTQLEAHSGLGVHLDDPGSVTERMRGATPPTIYELTLREAPFHGVRALRLTPLLEGTTFGRGGLLAHTFMLGPRGDSNGCVVFRNYPAFLAAFDSGRIRRLLVVAGT